MAGAVEVGRGMGVGEAELVGEGGFVGASGAIMMMIICIMEWRCYWFLRKRDVEDFAICRLRRYLG